MNDNSFEVLVDYLIEKLLPRVEQEVTQSGYFAPVYEEIRNTDEETKLIAGKLRLKVLKMPSEDVPDPQRRYIEASVFPCEGCYKTEMLVGAGDKDEIIAILKSLEFRVKLCRVYARLIDMLAD